MMNPMADATSPMTAERTIAWESVKVMSNRPKPLKVKLSEKAPKTKKSKMGMSLLVAWAGLRVKRMFLWRTLKMKKEMKPLIKGDKIQLEATDPIMVHSTPVTPRVTAPNPTMAPTIACVVETGRPK